MVRPRFRLAARDTCVIQIWKKKKSKVKQPSVSKQTFRLWIKK